VPFEMANSITSRSRDAMPVVFLDQSGQLGGAELFLADLAQACSSWSRVLLLEAGPFVDLLQQRGVMVETISLPSESKALSKSAGILSFAKVAPQLLAF
jgi:hypothetical protein